MPKKLTEPLQIENLIRTTLDDHDKDMLAQIQVDPKYKSLCKLIDNIIIDLENRSFEKASLLEEFLSIKWTRQALLLLKMQIRNEYNTITKKAHEEDKREQEESRYEKLGAQIQDSN